MEEELFMWLRGILLGFLLRGMFEKRAKWYDLVALVVALVVFTYRFISELV